MSTAEKLLSTIRPLLAVALGLFLGLMVTAFAGESPWNVFTILAKSAFGSWEDLGLTLFYTTPLILTGTSVALAFHAGLFNIGAEGQLTLGALAAAAVGSQWTGVPGWIAPWIAGFAAFAAGALWGAIPGWLRAKRGSHEVINTIMLNFIAAGIASYITLYWLRNTETQNPETLPVVEAYRISQLTFLGDSNVSVALFMALAVVGIFWFFLWKTVQGFELRAVGDNPSAARIAGISEGKTYILAMALAGGVAGLVGVGEVLGHAEKFRLGFSPEFGFMGIAVALLGRNRPFGILAAALLFGALHKGASDLDFETENVTRELTLILQALVILTVSADGLWDWTQRKRKRSAS